MWRIFFVDKDKDKIASAVQIGYTKVITVGDTPTALWSCTHIPNIIDLSRDKNVMARTRKYYLKNNYLILRSKIKVPRRSLRYATHRLMVMHPHTKISFTYLERQKCYGPGKKILFKKQLFDIEVKGQGPTKVITVCDTLPYDHAPTYQLSLTYLERQKCYDPDMKILLKKQLFDLEVKVP